jgi:nicotinamidase/pyrazinamidase
VAYDGEKEVNPMGDLGIILVDLQGDFTTWKKGPLAVKGTEKAYVDTVEEITKRFKEKGLLIFATQDWHPPNHISFYTNHPHKNPFERIRIGDREQVLWPPHCVQGTEGARLLLEESLFTAIIQKGTDPLYDSYSGFKDEGGKVTGLEKLLREHNITHVLIYGLATDYCVKSTALDAKELGLDVTVIKGLCRGVEEVTTRDAFLEMERAGIHIKEWVSF